MKKNWIKDHIPTAESVQNSNEVKGFKSHFKASCFWSYDRQPVAKGVAAGLAGSVIPGFQFFYAAILVFILRGNLPIALVSTLVTNPVTVVPITYFTYYIGTLIMGNGKSDFVLHEFEWDFSSFHAFWANVSAWGLQFGKAFFIGVPVVSISLGIIGYFGSLLVWRIWRLFR